MHFKLSSVLWLAAWETVLKLAPQLACQMRDYAGLAETDALIPQTETGKAYALSYKNFCWLRKAGNFADQVKEVLAVNHAAYSERISVLVGNYLRTL